MKRALAFDGEQNGDAGARGSQHRTSSRDLDLDRVVALHDFERVVRSTRDSERRRTVWRDRQQ